MIFLDTCAVIDYLRGNKQVRKLIGSEVVAISEITVFELYSGSFMLKKKDLTYVDTFISSSIILSIHSYVDSARINAYLRLKGLQIPETDVLIGSCALQHSFDSIITRDTKHFERIPGLSIIGY